MECVRACVCVGGYHTPISSFLQHWERHRRLLGIRIWMQQRLCLSVAKFGFLVVQEQLLFFYPHKQNKSDDGDSPRSQWCVNLCIFHLLNESFMSAVKLICRKWQISQRRVVEIMTPELISPQINADSVSLMWLLLISGSFSSTREESEKAIYLKKTACWLVAETKTTQISYYTSL